MKLALQITPNAKQSAIVGWVQDPRAGKCLKLRIAAPPLDGKANKALVQFLAKVLQIPKSAVELLHGESSRAKTVRIPDSCAESLSALVPEPPADGA